MDIGSDVVALPPPEADCGIRNPWYDGDMTSTDRRPEPGRAVIVELAATVIAQEDRAGVSGVVVDLNDGRQRYSGVWVPASGVVFVDRTPA